MTEDRRPNPPPAPTPRRRRRSLRRTVLSLCAAAIVAAWLPFSALYINALNKHAAAIGAARIVHTSPGHAPVVVTTTASGRVVSSATTASGSAVASAPVTVSTRAS